ncbi:MAG TPA: hypothetical protein VMO47_02840, partial [Rhodothermales bacterium]|nr:hypothetical protein [Rhodothermales bacterium]
MPRRDRCCADLDHDLLRHVPRTDALDRGVDRPGAVDVVVLDQEHVVEAVAVVPSTPGGHGVLVEMAETGRGLAGVVDPGLRPPYGVDVSARRGGDARGALEEVQRGALAGEQRHDRRAGLGDDPAGLDRRPLLHEPVEPARIVELGKGDRREVEPGDHPLPLADEHRHAAVGPIEHRLAGDVGQVLVEGP